MRFKFRLIMLMMFSLLTFYLAGCSDLGREVHTEPAVREAVFPSHSNSVPAASEITAGEGSHRGEKGITKISWKVVDYGGAPYFHLYVTLNDEKDYYAGYFWGENFETGEWQDTPADALTAASSNWTGSGELFYIYPKNKSELALMYHHRPYASGPEEWEAYQEILTIPVEKESEIDIGDIILVDEPYAWSANYSFILYDGFVLGGLDISGKLIPISEGNLREYGDNAVDCQTDWGFRLFRDGQYLDTVSYYGYDSSWLHDIVNEFNNPARIDSMVVKLEYNGEPFLDLAVNDGVPLTFGSKTKLATDNGAYADYIAEILADHGLEGEPVHIRDIVKTDLEGDGIDEVLITASNIHSSDQLKGQYSIVVLRKIIDGQVKSIFLTKQIRAGLPVDFEERLLYDYELREVVDLDHDGVCELLISETYYEGQFYLVYKLAEGAFQCVMKNGFGL